MRIKICGVTRVEDAELAIGLGADIVGLNFFPASPRFVTLEQARRIRRALGNRCEVAGVFVNATRDYVEERRRALALDYLQFHGDEEDDALRGWPVKVIRAIRRNHIVASQPIECPHADFLLFDTWHPNLFGGTGQARPLRELNGLALDRVFLAGGLNADNVAEAVALRPYAVDVASGVESAPGLKDPAKLRSFILNAKSAG